MKYVQWNLRNYLLEQVTVVVKQLICTREVIGSKLGQSVSSSIQILGQYFRYTAFLLNPFHFIIHNHLLVDVI